MSYSRCEKIIIHANPEIAGLIPGYLENRRKSIVLMKEALEKGDYESIEYLGHSMRGSGGGYGFSAISEIGRSLETAARFSNADDIRKQIDALESYVKCVEVVYD